MTTLEPTINENTSDLEPPFSNSLKTEESTRAEAPRHQPAPLSLYPSTKHILEYQNAGHRKILLRIELLQKLQDKINPYFHERLRSSIALTYEGSALVLMVNNPALAVKIQRQQAVLNQLIVEELTVFLQQHLAAKKQLHLMSELLTQFLPQGKINLLIRPFYKNS
jgi:hypothetical protein